MKNISFKSILLETAVCAIACDGHIDEREIEALKSIEKSSPYFSSEDLSKILDKSLKKASLDINEFKNSVFEKIKKEELNLLQQLSLVEISLRIISADNIEEEAEKEFMIELRNHLSISDLILYQRFGKIQYLGILDFEENFVNFKKTENPLDQTELK